MARNDDDTLTGWGACLFIGVLLICAYILYTSMGHLSLEVRKLECEDVYDTLECRVNKQIRDDIGTQIAEANRRIKEIEAEQLKVTYE